jgi:hypothetical protein
MESKGMESNGMEVGLHLPWALDCRTAASMCRSCWAVTRAANSSRRTVWASVSWAMVGRRVVLLFESEVDVCGEIVGIYALSE